MTEISFLRDFLPPLSYTAIVRLITCTLILITNTFVLGMHIQFLMTKYECVTEFCLESTKKKEERRTLFFLVNISSTWHLGAQGCMERLILWTFDPRHMQSFTETSFVSPDKSCSKAGRSYYTWRQRSLQGR